MRGIDNTPPQSELHEILDIPAVIGILASIALVLLMFALPNGGLQTKTLSIRQFLVLLFAYVLYALPTLMFWFGVHFFLA
jgi:membrane-bound ClpP family serine protease